MTDESLGEPINRLAVFNDLMLEMYYEEECLEHTYDAFLAEAGNTEWGKPNIDLIERPWRWQTCTEFGWYQTTNQVLSEEIGDIILLTVSLDRAHLWITFAFGVL